MPKVKIVLSTTKLTYGFDDEYGDLEHIIKESLTDWEEVSQSDLDVIRRNLNQLDLKEYEASHFYPILLVQVEESAKTIKTAVAKIAEKARMYETKRKLEDAAYEAKKKAAKEKRERKKLEELKKKFEEKK